MKTLCPHCATAFRITPDQLRARNGMVRCGQCQAVFNAFDNLTEEVPLAPPVLHAVVAAEAAPSRPVEISEALQTTENHEAGSAIDTASREPAETISEALSPAETGAEADSPASGETPEAASVEPPVESLAEHTHPTTDAEEAAQAPVEHEAAAEETPEQSTQAVREAGLAAVRELSEAPGYNRWSAGALAGDPSLGMGDERARGVAWPFVLACCLLLVLLLGQVGYRFRTDLVQSLPFLRAVYATLGIAVPLPQSPDLVTIEASDLQSDNTRGLLVLQATLKNRATVMQAWPALELTLTDANDGVVLRKVFEAAEYLPPKTDPQGFPAGSDLAVSLWLESRLPAAGYRLYVFYP